MQWVIVVAERVHVELALVSLLDRMHVPSSMQPEGNRRKHATRAGERTKQYVVMGNSK